MKRRIRHKEHDRPSTRTSHRRIASKGLKGVIAAQLTMPHQAMHVVATSLNDQGHTSAHGVEDWRRLSWIVKVSRMGKVLLTKLQAVVLDKETYAGLGNSI